MKKRVLVMVLMLTILLSNSLITFAYYRDSMTRLNITDTLEKENYMVYDYDTQMETEFTYNVPKDGATVLIFFSPGCPNSQQLFKDLNDCPWLASEYVEVVAVESKDTMSRNETTTFLNTYIPDQKDEINMYYDNNDLQWEYVNQISHFNLGVSWAFVLVITENEDNQVIRYAESGMNDAGNLYSALCSVSESFAKGEKDYSEREENPKEQTGVAVSVAGWNYQNSEVYDLEELIQEFRAENGLPAFEISISLGNLAELRTHELAVDYGTTRPNGESLSDLKYNDGDGVVDSEFIAIGHMEAQTVLENWLDDDTHRNYLLETKADTMGVACFITDNTKVWTAVFGTDNEDIASALNTSSHHLVRILPEKLEPVQESYDIVLGLEETASFEVEYQNSAAEFAPSILVPETKDVYDENGNLIAKLSVELGGGGAVYIYPETIGSGSVELPVYDGQEDPVVLNLTVTEENTGIEPEIKEEDNVEKGVYDISVSCSENGQAYAAMDSVEEGQKVLLTVIPDEGYKVSRCYTMIGGTISNSSYMPEDYYEKINSYTYAFIMPDSDVSIEIQFKEANSLWENGFEPLEHYHNYELINVKSASCAEEGYSGDWICTECNKVVVAGESVDPIGHIWAPYVVTVPSTCRTEGVIHRDCKYCDEFQMLPIGTLGSGFPGELNNPFRDVKKGSYYFDSVLWAVGRNITSGTSATTFTPDGTCTRAQTVTFLWRAQGSPEPTTTKSPFTDVAAGSYYEKAVLWAVEQGITSGMTTTTFGPDKPCTRAHVVTFIHRWQGEPESTLTKHFFTDVKQGDYYYEAMLWAVEEEITVGMTATKFGPENPCTRAQIVTFLRRAMVN